MHHAQIDRLSYLDSVIHRLDARVKLISVIVFTVFVISSAQTSFSILSCYAVGPFALLVLGRIPFKFVLKQILIVSPFILVLAVSNLFYDKAELTVTFGPMKWDMTYGLLRCVVILGKFIITMAALMSLVATTRFSDLLKAMTKLGVPEVLAGQLGFLYRYIFLLTDRAHHILRARAGRRFGKMGIKTEIKTAAAMIGTLCLGSIDTAGRVHTAMQARGFTGRIQTLSVMRVSKNEWLFITAFCLYLFAVNFLARVF